MVKVDATRSEIARILAGYKFRIRVIDFSDLMRDYAYVLSVWDGDRWFSYGGGTVFSQESLERYKPLIALMEQVKNNYTYNGKHIL